MIDIFHVEDDPDIREIVSMALRLAGEFDVTQHPSGTQALAQPPRTAPDVFLLDVMLPDMTGFETLQQLRALPALSDVPAIFMTAHRDDQRLEALCKQAQIDVIHKPIDPLALGSQIRQKLAVMR